MGKAAAADISPPPSTGVKNHGSSQSDGGTNVPYGTHVVVGYRRSSPKPGQHSYL